MRIIMGLDFSGLNQLNANSASAFAEISRRQEEALRAVEQANQERIDREERLDVLEGNTPAERLYTGFGFRYMATLKMYYEDTGWTNFMLYEYVI